MMQFGGDFQLTNPSTWSVPSASWANFWLLVVAVLVVVGVLALLGMKVNVANWFGDGFMFLEVPYQQPDRVVRDYDCDFRGGCNTGLFDQRELTNIVLDAKRKGSPIDVCTSQFDSYVPGVDRNLVSQLVNSTCVRNTADMTSGKEMWREPSDKVLQQFANTGIVISNARNPLMTPGAIKVPVGGTGDVPLSASESMMHGVNMRNMANMG